MRIFLEVVLKGKFGSSRTYLEQECGFKEVELDQVLDILTIEGEGEDFAANLP